VYTVVDGGASVVAKYAAAMEAVDIQMGRVLETLDDQGFDDRTVVFFAGDNGTPEEIVGVPAKSSAFEAGVHVPLMVRSPGHAGGRDINRLVSLVDLFPTALELANAPQIDVQIDGLSLVPLLAGNDDVPWREWVYAGRARPEHSVGAQQAWSRMVRTMDWKFIDDWTPNEVVGDGLYDMHGLAVEGENLLLGHQDLEADEKAAYLALTGALDEVLYGP
jgi:arylsulfatase A-like enzyme